MRSEVILASEIRAAGMVRPGIRSSTRHTWGDIRAAADELILLAEQIKAERARLTMTMLANMGRADVVG